MRARVCDFLALYYSTRSAYTYIYIRFSSWVATKQKYWIKNDMKCYESISGCNVVYMFRNWHLIVNWKSSAKCILCKEEYQMIAFNRFPFELLGYFIFSVHFDCKKVSNTQQTILFLRNYMYTKWKYTVWLILRIIFRSITFVHQLFVSNLTHLISIGSRNIIESFICIYRNFNTSVEGKRIGQRNREKSREIHVI